MRPFTPGLLIFHEKHGNWHYDVPTENHYQAACLTVLTRRFEEGYWYHDPLEEESHEWDPEPPQMSLEEIEKLPFEFKEIIVLKHFQELSYKEISEMLGIPMGSVMSRLYYARKKLKDNLKDILD